MQRPKVFYIYDALCGWCYGFSPVMKKFYQNYKDEFDFEVLSGGMVLGDRVGPIGQVAPYIKNAYQRVEEMTGVKFGEKFLKEVLEPGETIFSSEKPSLAMTTFKAYQPEQVIDFAHTLQNAIYYEGKDLNQWEAYKELVNPYGIDDEEFVQKMQTDEIGLETRHEFAQVGNWGINGFPSVVIVTSPTQGYLLARGYTPYDTFEQTLQSVMEEVNNSAS